MIKVKEYKAGQAKGYKSLGIYKTLYSARALAKRYNLNSRNSKIIKTKDGSGYFLYYK
jgi:hypothetical protein